MRDALLARMRRPRSWILVVSAMILVSPGALSGQTAEVNRQTPENAHRFFAIAAKDREFVDYRFKIVPPRQLLPSARCARLKSGECWDGVFYRGKVIDAELRLRTSILQSWEADGICLTKIVHRPQGVIIQEEYTEDGYQATSSVFYSRPETETFTIDWMKVSSAEAANGSLIIKTSQPFSSTTFSYTRNDEPSIELRFNDADLATRAAFAAEVIRLRCDPLSGTGF